ncbi:MAG: nitrate reductase molybdenum cofactor assembly chaperone [Hyphomicrobiales bacterium]|nr:nitrate reductase molybdenum cofactor assembly chaperone [Hyphomicrobiales bacterium]
MAKTFKALSALLNYPTAELKSATAEIRSCLREERLLCDGLRRGLGGLLQELETGDLYDLQERYVLLFDRTRSLSLHIFEHVHGESRDRGQAMIDLKALYEKHGLFISQSELPDFLPLFLEFLSTLPRTEAQSLLGQAAHILKAVAERLEKRGSCYEAVFRALIALAEAGVSANEPDMALVDEDTDPNDLETLDAAWAEEPVVFGPGAAMGCKDSLIAKIRAARRPVPANET